jgi:hypothetical protein
MPNLCFISMYEHDSALVKTAKGAGDTTSISMGTKRHVEKCAPNVHTFAAVTSRLQPRGQRVFRAVARHHDDVASVSAPHSEDIQRYAREQIARRCEHDHRAFTSDEVPVTRTIKLTLSRERKGAISIILITPAVAWNAPISRMGLVHRRGLGHEARCDVDGHVGEVVVCCYALLRMRPLLNSWAECSVVISC